jgi:hypothetical protein
MAGQSITDAESAGGPDEDSKDRDARPTDVTDATTDGGDRQ